MRRGLGLVAVLVIVAAAGPPAPARSRGVSAEAGASAAASESPRVGIPDSTETEPVSLQLVRASVRAPDGSGAPESIASATLTLHGPTRGDPSAPMALRISPRTSTIALAVPPLDAPKGAWVQVELRSAAGKVLATSRHRQSDLTGRRMLVMSSAPRPLKPGRYTLSLNQVAARSSPASLPDSAQYTFELRSTDR